MASNSVSTYPLATGEIAAARLALIECVCGTPGREVMQSLGVLPGMRVADIGCGTGQTTRWFASQVGQRGEVAAVDFSADQRGEEKRLWEYTFIEASPSMVAAGYISAAELEQLARELRTAAEDENVVVVHPLYFASWGQRTRCEKR
jgi:SAM-dependent methyltransferase